MRSTLASLLAGALSAGAVLVPAATAAADTTTGGSDLVISQIYGAGGNQGGVYAHDYVELFNRGTSPVSIDGLSLQYTSASGANALGFATNTRTALSGTVEPGQSFLVKGGKGEQAGLTPLPTPDLDPGLSAINLSQTDGRVAVVTGTASLGCNSLTNCTAAQLDRIVDLVGYGSAAFFEGSAPAPRLTTTSAAFRLGGGCTDTDDNRHDVVVAHPAPRNGASPATPCSAPVREAVGGQETGVQQPGVDGAGVPVGEGPSETGESTIVVGEPTPDVTAPAQLLVPAAPVACSTPIRQPVNCDGSSVFKLGSTIPVKFELPNDGTARFSAVRTSAQVLGDDLEGPPADLTPTNGVEYRYAGGAYHLNWNTRGLEAGTYRVTIETPGETHTVRISLRR